LGIAEITGLSHIHSGDLVLDGESCVGKKRLHISPDTVLADYRRHVRKHQNGIIRVKAKCSLDVLGNPRLFLDDLYIAEHLYIGFMTMGGLPDPLLATLRQQQCEEENRPQAA